MPPVSFHPEARQELEESFHWYEEQVPGLGEQLVLEVDRGLAAIQERPETWPAFSGDARRYFLHRFPFALIYVFEEGEIRVLAVMHLSRKPGYWSHRRF